MRGVALAALFSEFSATELTRKAELLDGDIRDRSISSLRKACPLDALTKENRENLAAIAWDHTPIGLPVATHKKWPRYPREARKAEIEGNVCLRIAVHTSGSVLDVQVLESRPFGAFEESVLQVLDQLRYRPILDEKGQALSCWVEVCFEFKLE
ncbi:MAG: energy transducer TonB [Planctomycetota bacterium]